MRLAARPPASLAPRPLSLSYLLVTVGVVMIKSKEAGAKDVLKDLARGRPAPPSFLGLCSRPAPPLSRVSASPTSP